MYDLAPLFGGMEGWGDGGMGGWGDGSRKQGWLFPFSFVLQFFCDEKKIENATDMSLKNGLGVILFFSLAKYMSYFSSKRHSHYIFSLTKLAIKTGEERISEIATRLIWLCKLCKLLHVPPSMCGACFPCVYFPVRTSSIQND